MANKRKHSSDYCSYRHSDKRKRREERSSQSAETYNKIEECKQELSRFLEDKANIKQQNEFWTFYEKYLNIQKLKPRDPNVDRNVMLDTYFPEKKSILLEKVPVLSKHGEKISIRPDDFNEFLLIILIYRDFLQKSKFLKLKKIRTSQVELPIFQYKKEIIDKLKSAKVMLIAGNTGIMKCVLRTKTNLKLILMSATINLDLFSNYFSEENIQVIQVPGRLYPIEINYRPIVKDPFERKRDKFNCTPYLQILQLIDENYKPNQKGDVLIFLNGLSEISTLTEAVTEYSRLKKNWIVLPLHSSLSLEEQNKVFDYPPDGIRKCIISTNIAETSVTIDGIRFVLDSGKCNRMIYNTNLGVSKLSETNISQDSAKQRSGRAGRTGPGVCYRLYSEEDFKNFELFSPAEIHLVPLDSLILHMISLGLSDIESFPFLEKPSNVAIEESLEKLKFTGALSLSEDCLTLTPLGDSLSQLPVNLSIGKMLILSTIFENANSVIALASLLSVQNPLTQNAYRDTTAQNLRSPLESNHGDPISLLNYYKEWLIVKQGSNQIAGGSRNSSVNSRTWSKKRCLEEERFYEATKLIEQFKDILSEINLLPKIETELSSRERAIRYGELKHLKHLKYEIKNKSESNQRKQLKYEMYDFGESSEKEDSKADIRDVEFRISKDFKSMQKLLNETSANSFKDLMMLKIILTSGFYPQVAVGDEHNSSKTVSERLFHTKQKNYVFLRPMSYFATNPESLELSNTDIEVPPPGYFSKRPISKKHELLIYQSILETKKVYLVNVMRMPCIQTLLLFGKTIATNNTLTRFIVDDFLLLDVPYLGLGKNILLRALALRKKWINKLDFNLNNPLHKPTKADKEEMFYFIDALVNYMATEVPYNVKRLLPADLKQLYTFTTDSFNSLHDKVKNPFDEQYVMRPNESKGGFNVTENVIFNSLTQEEWTYQMEEQVFRTEWVCKYCKEVFTGSSLFDFMQHEEFCPNKSEQVKEKQETDDKKEETTAVKANSRRWYCEKCCKDLVLTSIEFVKHKRSCNGE
ncbi:probable ATP-dependent RNA helicase DHX34 isoform X3 [Anthonomus grandis grandis]|uniref:probable ATP-dependent RNA helicase DHX34 isoform X3 n=1 Tax=Anthonomus grandis grandis TaxID=2921223 RepID=UPI0021656D0B|nr:probable ATP-dependent RNA helicase DHX34 isoform X3 [Anthonomus grandis grandis]